MKKFHFGEKVKVISGFYRGNESDICGKRLWFYKMYVGDYCKVWVPCWNIQSVDPKYANIEFQNKLEKIIK